MNRHGSVILEGCVTLFAGVLSIFLLMEISRLAEMHISMEQAVFIYTRARAYGNTKSQAEKKSKDFLDAFWGNRFRFPLEFTELPIREGWVVRGHVRYPQLFSFPIDAMSKHHLEVTKSCRFPG